MLPRTVRLAGAASVIALGIHDYYSAANKRDSFLCQVIQRSNLSADVFPNTTVYSVSSFVNRGHGRLDEPHRSRVISASPRGSMIAKKKLLLLCSHEEYDTPGSPIINAIKQNLGKEFDITTWMDNIVFPIADTRSSVERFLQSLFTFDGVILLLTGDDIRQGAEGTKEQVVRDNLVFELGACMAHFGPARTFVMMPEEDDPLKSTILPSYFRNYKPLLWRKTANPIGDTSIACGHVVARFRQTKYKYCDIGLPAMMSANAYIKSFIVQVIDHLDSPEHDTCNCDLHVCVREHGNKYNVGVILDEEVLGYDRGTRKASEVLRYKNQLREVILKSVGNRRVATMFAVIDNEVWVVDVPTIMDGFRETIKEMDLFWGTGGVDIFREIILKSELGKFKNEVVRRCKNDYKAVHVIDDISELGLSL